MWFLKVFGLTARQALCIFGFVLPFALLLLSFIALYTLRIFYNNQLFEKIAISSMELWWAYFPIIGAAVLFRNSRRVKGKSNKLTFWQMFFVSLHILLLVALIFFTLWNLDLRFYSQSFLVSWIPSICLELVWIALQAHSIFSWICNNWKKESVKSLHGELTVRQRDTFSRFLPALCLLIFCAIAAHSFQRMENIFAFQIFETFENALFVYFPGVQSYVWIRDRWSEIEDEKVDSLVNSTCV